MKLIISKIPLGKLLEEVKIYHQLDSNLYGEELSNRVAQKLTKPNQQGIYFAHLDYCGLGIFYTSETFTLTTVYDGYWPNMIIAEFESKPEFI